MQNNDNSGVLFKNEKATTNERQPIYKGEIKVDGKDYFISLWKRASKNGVTYLSVATQPKGNVVKKENTPVEEKAKDTQTDEVLGSDEIPW